MFVDCASFGRETSNGQQWDFVATMSNAGTPGRCKGRLFIAKNPVFEAFNWLSVYRGLRHDKPNHHRP